jgi:hypothetical protein
MQFNDTSVDELIKHSGFASFGHGTKEVIDEEYRNAYTMSPDQFCTTFNPDHIHDIIQANLL